MPGRHNARYDPFGRRIARYSLDTGTGEITGKRFIWDGWSAVAERAFDSGATEANEVSTLERVYVNGIQIDEPIYCAVDADADRALATNLNDGGPGNDAEFYYLNNRLGSIMGLLDAGNPARMLEYVRYDVYGTATVLGIVDGNMDGLEDTPLDLGDNNAAGPLAASAFGNEFLFTARRLDEATGLMYYRHRQYLKESGRFVGRDPLYFPTYQYAWNCPTGKIDPSGLLVIEQVDSARNGTEKTIPREGKPSVCGKRNIMWQFTLTNKNLFGPDGPCKEGRGYFIQEVIMLENIEECRGERPCPGELLEFPTVATERRHFWEVFPVEPSGPPMNHPSDRFTMANIWGYTDASTFKGQWFTRGFDQAVGIVKFFCQEVTGDLGGGATDPEPNAENKAKGWKASDGEDGDPPAGGLVATSRRPDFWGQPSSGAEGTAARHATSEWNCCGETYADIQQGTSTVTYSPN